MMETKSIQTNPSFELGPQGTPFAAEEQAQSSTQRLIDRFELVSEAPMAFALGTAALVKAAPSVVRVVQTTTTALEAAETVWGSAAVYSGGAVATPAYLWVAGPLLALGVGVAAGFIFNWGFEKIAGKSFGERIYEWMHPEELASRKNQVVLPTDPEASQNPGSPQGSLVLIEKKSEAPELKTLNVTASAKKDSGDKKKSDEKKLSTEKVEEVLRWWGRRRKTIAETLMGKPEVATKWDIKFLEQKFYEAQSKGQNSSLYLTALEHVSNDHPDPEIKQQAKSAFERASAILEKTVEAMATLKLDTDELLKLAEAEVLAEEKDDLRIGELVLLIIEINRKSEEQERLVLTEKLLLHRLSRIRQYTVLTLVNGYPGGEAMIPWFWQIEKSLIERDLMSSDEETVWDTCGELDQFVEWRVEEAIKMLKNLETSENPVIQQYFEIRRLTEK